MTEEALPRRLLGVGASALTRGAAVQGHLFDDEERKRQGALDRAVDAIRGRLGQGAIRRGSLLVPGKPGEGPRGGG